MIHYNQNDDFATSLKNVLNDGKALKIFMEWIERNKETSIHPIHLHYAIIAYKKMIDDKDQRAFVLANEIMRKYLRPEEGLCAIIPKKVRKEIQADFMVMSVQLNSNLFDPCTEYIDNYLQRQHFIFTTSDEFLKLINSPHPNSFSYMEANPYPTINRHQNKQHNTLSRRVQPNSFAVNSSAPKYSPFTTRLSTATAESLLRGNNALGEKTVNKLFPPALKYPYAGQATTSQQDSTYSSSFSSEATGYLNNHKLGVHKQEQLRHNPPISTLPRLQKIPNIGMSYDHSTIEGRKIFALELIRRLEGLASANKTSDAMNDKLKDISLSKSSARDVICSSHNQSSSIEATRIVEEDAELDQYIKQNLENDGSKVPSEQQSPLTHFGSKLNRVQGSLSNSASPERHHHFNSSTLQPKSMLPSKSHMPSPYGQNGFAPPPKTSALTTKFGTIGGRQKYYEIDSGMGCQTLDRNNIYKYKLFPDHDDTSGFSSMATTDSSGSEIKSPQQKAIFQLAREMAIEDNVNSKVRISSKSHTLTLIESPKNEEKLLTIGYRLKIGDAPIIAHIPKTSITFREFRKTFCISSKTKHQFYFKAICEDMSAPYQLNLIGDDHVVLPTFEGRVWAECKTGTDSQ